MKINEVRETNNNWERRFLTTAGGRACFLDKPTDWRCGLQVTEKLEEYARPSRRGGKNGQGVGNAIPRCKRWRTRREGMRSCGVKRKACHE